MKNAGRWFKTFSGAALMAAVLFVSSSPAQIGSKVQAFIATMERAQSIEQIEEAYKQSNFSKAELDELARLLEKPDIKKRLTSKIATLVDKAAKPVNDRTDAWIRLRRQAFLKERSVRLANMSKSADMLLQKARSPREKVVVRSISTDMRTAAKQRSPMPGGTAASIDDITPSTAMVGRAVTIIGSGFGASRGRMTLVLGTFRDARPEMVECPVTRWSDTVIQATIPTLIAPWVGESEKTCVVWAKMAGGETGPNREIRVAPDPAHLTPEIRTISTDRIEPNAQVTIEGRNFLSSRRGTVGVRLNNIGVTYDGRVDVWSDTAIRFQFPDIDRVHPQRCTVTVTNHLGHSVSREMDFEPVYELEILRAEFDIDLTILMFGLKRTSRLYRFDLINGWTVRSTHFEHSGGRRSGCKQTRVPVVGSSDPRSDIWWWVDGFSWIKWTDIVEITGPRGFAYR